MIRPADIRSFAGSRDFGTEIRARVAAILKAEGEVVVDLAGVTTMTPSFADECFGRLCEEHGFDVTSTKVHVQNAAQFKPLIDAVIRMRLQRLGMKSSPSNTD